MNVLSSNNIIALIVLPCNSSPVNSAAYELKMKQLPSLMQVTFILLTLWTLSFIRRSKGENWPLSLYPPLTFLLNTITAHSTRMNPENTCKPYMEVLILGDILEFMDSRIFLLMWEHRGESSLSLCSLYCCQLVWLMVLSSTCGTIV